jgi:hypothetical protein
VQASKRARSERKGGLQGDVAIAGNGAAELVSGERLRLIEERRQQYTIGSAEVHIVERIDGDNGEREPPKPGFCFWNFNSEIAVTLEFANSLILLSTEIGDLGCRNWRN